MSIETSARAVVDAVGHWRAGQSGPLVVAIDGHGAAGKSAIAAVVSDAAGATLVHVDDFFRESGSDGAGMAAYYDWDRLRGEALEPLRRGAAASYAAFDWETDGFRPGLVAVAPANVIVVEGVTATADALAGCIDRTVLVVTPERERLERLHERIGAGIWDEAWLAAERGYLGSRPERWFDLVVSGSAD